MIISSLITIANRLNIMNNTLIIKKFGPLKDNEVQIKDIILVLGPQASGKSTFAKLVYYFLSIKSQIIDVLSLILSDSIDSKYFFTLIQKSLRNELYGYFDSFLLREYFDVCYYFSDDLFIHIYNNNKRDYKIVFSSKLRTALQALVNSVKEYKKNNNVSLLGSSNISSIKEQKISFLNEQSERINNIINNRLDDKIYIPASRSYVNKFTDLQFFKPIDNQFRNIDLLDQEFSAFVGYLKKHYNLSLEEQLNIYKNNKLFGVNYNFKFPKEAQKLIVKILKGEYHTNGKNEHIVFNDTKGEHKIEVAFSSSGQQESLWILNILYRQILEEGNFYTVIEEPEAHLYPDAQNNIAKLIALAANKGVKLLVTTHSPYFLGCLSTLFYAKTVENKIKPQVIPNKVVPDFFRLDINKASIYYIKNGKLVNVYDKKAEYITVEVIDKASEENNNRLDKLIDFEG